MRGYVPEPGRTMTWGMRVWIDQDLCTGDGICAEIAPDLFFMHVGDGLAYVKDRGTTGLTGEEPTLKMNDMAQVPDELLDATIEAAEECPGECIFIEAD